MRWCRAQRRYTDKALLYAEEFAYTNGVRFTYNGVVECAYNGVVGCAYSGRAKPRCLASLPLRVRIAHSVLQFRKVVRGLAYRVLHRWIKWIHLDKRPVPIRIPGQIDFVPEGRR